MQFDTYPYSNEGKHYPNEDDFDYRQEEDGGLWIVADGLGGHVKGEVASRLAVQYTLTKLARQPMPQDAEILKAMAEINQVIRGESGPCTTVVCAICRDQILKYFNIGDSRFYYFHDGHLVWHTADHSVAYSLYYSQNEIRYDDLRFHPDRSRLTHALGASDNEPPQLYPEIPVSTGDAFLLCTDGFWEYIHETEMELDLAKASSAKAWGDIMLQRVFIQSSDVADRDNFTILAVMVK